tara:strand:- start:320 stop:514 length:195 start_codon:yes stop_codon:yes gene_type:complete
MLDDPKGELNLKSQQAAQKVVEMMIQHYEEVIYLDDVAQRGGDGVRSVCERVRVKVGCCVGVKL